ncbi:Ubiquitin thioesterase otubain-like [Diplonema papillatum]|nr:Ubiquitin thioesterase otubain-like [Diplonema papillatum]|eukprot:gene14783-22630_t
MSGDGNVTSEQVRASVQHEDDLLAEQTKKPRVGSEESIETLVNEFKGGDPIYVVKSNELAKRYKTLRRIRRDGSCFIRAYLFGIAEHCLSSKPHCDVVIQAIADLQPKLQKLHETDLLDDFHDAINELFADIRAGKLTPASLHARFQDQLSDWIAYYCRFAASCYMQTNEDMFAPFLDTDVKTYCTQNIETVGCEFDQCAIIALANALRTVVKIEYFDLSPSDACNCHTFPEDDKTPLVHLLYRPGHYDLIYLK